MGTLPKNHPATREQLFALGQDYAIALEESRKRSRIRRTVVDPQLEKLIEEYVNLKRLEKFE